MAVQEQTPLQEYTANGIAKQFDLEFDCESADHLIVSIDDLEVLHTDWYLSGNAIVFHVAPASGKQVKIQRNTPFNRLADYQSYNNSFRPPAINKDLDRIWWKLQELGVADWILSNRINALKAYVDDRDDELRAYLVEEIRKQGVALDQLDDYYNYLMQRLAQIAVDKGWDASFVVDASGKTQQEINDLTGAPYRVKASGYNIGERVVLENGDIVRSTVAGNTVDPNVDMTGWVNKSEEVRNFKEKLYVTPFDFGYKNSPSYDFNHYLQLAIDSGHKVIKGANSKIDVSIKSPVFINSDDLDIDLSMITATVDNINVATDVWTVYDVPISAGYCVIGLLNVTGRPNSDYKIASTMPAVGSSTITLAAHGYVQGQKIGLEVEYKLGIVNKNRLLVTVERVIDANTFVIDYSFFYAPLSLRIHTFANVVSDVKLKSYRKVTDTNTATTTFKSFSCVTVAWAENVIVKKGSEFINGLLSSMHFYMANNCEDYKAVTKNPRATSGGFGYTTQNLYSRNIKSYYPRNYGGRHVYDWTGSNNCEVVKPKSYYLPTTSVLITHGLFEHDLIVDGFVDIGSTIPEIAMGHSGEDYGRTTRNVIIKNSTVDTIRIDSLNCSDFEIKRCKTNTALLCANTEVVKSEINTIANVRALSGEVAFKKTKIKQVYINPQYLDTSGAAVSENGTADIYITDACEVDGVTQSAYLVNSINFKDSEIRYTTPTAQHYELKASSAITYKNMSIASLNATATGHTLTAPYIHFDADCVLKDISYVINTPQFGVFDFRGRYLAPSIDKVNPLITLNGALQSQYFFKGATLKHKYASSASGADLAIKTSANGRNVLEISNSYISNNVDIVSEISKYWTMTVVSNMWDASNFIAPASTANKVFANNVTVATS